MDEMSFVIFEDLYFHLVRFCRQFLIWSFKWFFLPSKVIPCRVHPLKRELCEA